MAHLTLLEETNFWSRQLSEHLMFLQIMLIAPELKEQAGMLHQQYEAARRQLASVQSGQEAAALVEGPTRAAIAFQQQVLVRLANGEWLGLAYPLFLDHITREAEMYAHFAYGDPPPADSIAATVTRLGGDHALFAAHLLDPTEDGLVEQARKAGVQLYNLSAQGPTPTMLRQGAEAERAVARFLTQNQIGQPGGALSIIPSALAEHVLREQDYFAQKLLAELQTGQAQSPELIASQEPMQSLPSMQMPPQMQPMSMANPRTMPRYIGRGPGVR